MIGVVDTDNLHLGHDGLPHVLDLDVYLVMFLACWVGGIIPIILTISTFLLEHSFMLKSYRWEMSRLLCGGWPIRF